MQMGENKGLSYKRYSNVIYVIINKLIILIKIIIFWKKLTQISCILEIEEAKIRGTSWSFFFRKVWR